MLSTALRLISGNYTPFLVPSWDREERDIVARWLNGERFPDAVTALMNAVSSGFPADTVVVPVNLGRTAIRLCLDALRLPPGSRVLLQSFACDGTVTPVIEAGLEPVFADVDGTFCLSGDSVSAVSDEKIRVVIIQHLSGLRAPDTDRIISWARANGVFVIEDCAQALGLMHEGRPAGLAGDAAVFSCHGGKQIPAPGGAWLMSSHPAVVDALNASLLPGEPETSVATRLQAFVDRYCSTPAQRGRTFLRERILARFRTPASPSRTPSPSYRISDLEAALITAQLKKLPGIIPIRRENARFWRDALTAAGIPGIAFLPDGDTVYTKMLLSFDGEEAFSTADALRRHLWRSGVEIEYSYVPLHLDERFSRFPRCQLPVTERRWRTAFSVPVRPNLSDKDRRRITAALRSASVRKGYTP